MLLTFDIATAIKCTGRGTYSSYFTCTCVNDNLKFFKLSLDSWKFIENNLHMSGLDNFPFLIQYFGHHTCPHCPQYSQKCVQNRDQIVLQFQQHWRL